MRWRENSWGDELIKQNNEMLWNSREKVARRYIALELNIHFCVLWQLDVLFGRLLSWGGYMLAFVSFSKNNTYFLKHEVNRKMRMRCFLKWVCIFLFISSCLFSYKLSQRNFFYIIGKNGNFFFKWDFPFLRRHPVKPILWFLPNRNPEKDL